MRRLTPVGSHLLHTGHTNDTHLRMNMLENQLPFTSAWRQCAGSGITTLSQIAVLECIAAGVIQTEIAKKIQITHSAVSRTCGILEVFGFITNTRSETDRRAVVLALTETGRTLLASLSSAVSGDTAEAP